MTPEIDSWRKGWGSPDSPENAKRIAEWVWCPVVWAVLTDDPCAYAYEHPRDCPCGSRFPLSVGGRGGFDQLAIVADLLRRFERPRSYAGDYHVDFAERILRALSKEVER